MTPRVARLASIAFMTLACAAAACGRVSTAEPTLAASLVPATSTAASLPTDTVPAPTAAPTGEDVLHYHLRLEYSTTSDWSTLELLTPEHVLTMRLVGKLGDPVNASAGSAMIALNQPLAASKAGDRVGLTVDYALDPESVGSSLRFRVRKGDINSSAVRLSLITQGEATLIKEVNHKGVVANSHGENALEFDITLAQLGGIAPEESAASLGGYPHLLWAFYYPWYARSDWSSAQLADRPPEPYDSASRATIERHVRQAKQAGIDGFISSWWGPGSDTDRNLTTLLDVAQDEGFLISIYFETLADGGARPASEMVRWLSYAIDTYGDHPAFSRIDGKPVVVLWATGAAPLDEWRDVLVQVRATGRDAFFLGMGYDLSNLAVFDGLHEYGVFTYKNLEQVVADTGRSTRYYSLLDEGGVPKLWAATVQPGYDDRLIPGREGLVQERDDGAYYRRTWEAALASAPDWIFITTWNEWWETTHIEPSRAFGELYLDLTREYAAKWKSE